MDNFTKWVMGIFGVLTVSGIAAIMKMAIAMAVLTSNVNRMSIEVKELVSMPRFGQQDGAEIWMEIKDIKRQMNDLKMTQLINNPRIDRLEKEASLGTKVK